MNESAVRGFAEHIVKLEKRISELESALKVISTWATFQNGSELNPMHVEKLCQKVLK